MADAAHDSAPQMLFRLVYRSRNRILPGERRKELGALFTDARRRNKERQVTGALLVSGDWFVQLLEGEEATVRDLYARIERDPRHERVAVLETGPADRRVFARWAMARVSDGDESDIPLIAHPDGIAPAAGRPTTPEQDDVLAAMRDALRAAPQAV